MYYITNHNHQIIAADSGFLGLLHIETIDELYTKIALGDITFTSPLENKVTITTSQGEESYATQISTLRSILGDMTLVQLEISEEEAVSPEKDFTEDLLIIGSNEINDIPVSDTALEEVIEKNDKIDESLPEEDLLSLKEEITTPEANTVTHDDLSILDDEPISFNDTVTETEEEISLLDDTPMDLQETETRREDHEEILPNETESSDELFDLLLPNAPEETIDEISLQGTNEQKADLQEEDHTPILINTEHISKEIGISTEDYNNFLNEYIDTAITLEKDLKSDQDEKRSHAITTLSHLASVLHLPMITEIITQIKNQSVENQNSSVSALYNTLSRLTTQKADMIEEVSVPLAEADIAVKPSGTEGFGTISLDDVKPIHFDFQLEEAANDLSLPVELIEEFVHDFIEQGHTETKKMLAAYEKGDLDTIQKIGHLLKGASSNLRINPLSDTLYKIQFCEDSTQLETLIKDYWAHFLSFETQINLISK